MMIRSFLPIGQGAFYCEQFRSRYSNEKINIIYDCGSLTDVKIVESQIRNTFENNETIHAVFISHLDEDHINGLPYLLKYCKVKKIFFPLLTKANAKYIKLYNTLKSGRRDSFAASFIDNPYEAFNRLNIEGTPGLYQIRENGQNDNEADYNGIDAGVVSSGENVADIIFEGSFKDDAFKEWLYIPYNFRRTDRVAQLAQNLSTAFGRNMDNEDLYSIWEKGTVIERDAIIDAYKRVKGSFNTNSMTLYSGTEIVQYWQTMCNEKCHKYCWRHTCGLKPAGCLYTGDYDAAGKYKWKGLFNAYTEYWNNIGCIQIPHHGSKHNYNDELSNLDAYYIISAGKNNKFQHPHSIVIKDLLFHGHFPHIVSENKSSEVHLVINM